MLNIDRCSVKKFFISLLAYKVFFFFLEGREREREDFTESAANELTLSYPVIVFVKSSHKMWGSI